MQTLYNIAQRTKKKNFCCHFIELGIRKAHTAISCYPPYLSDIALHFYLFALSTEFMYNLSNFLIFMKKEESV